MPIMMRFKKRTVKPFRKITLAKKVEKIEKGLREHKPDIKSVDFSIPATLAISSLASYSVLCQQIPEGTDYNQRVGLGVELSSIDFKATIQLGVTATNSGYQYPNYVQAFLVKDLQTVENASTLTVSDVWTNAAAVPELFRTIPTHSRYKVLATSNIVNLHRIVSSQDASLASESASTAIPTQNGLLRLRHSFSYKLKSLYNGAGATAIQKNGVYLVLLASGGKTPEAFVLNGNIRTNYYDM